MKWQAIIVLLAIALTVLAPPSLPLTVARGGHAEIGDLDVCHQATPALSSAGEMPCINSVPAVHRPASFVTLSASQKPFFLQSLFTFDREHPPKA
jgi:hypothetical protein